MHNDESLKEIRSKESQVFYTTISIFFRVFSPTVESGLFILKTWTATRAGHSAIAFVVLFKYRKVLKTRCEQFIFVLTKYERY